MNIKQITDALKKHGSACLTLANDISKEGKPLNQEDKDLIRVALLPMIKAACLDIQYAFLNDDARCHDIAADTIYNAFQFFKKDKHT